MDLRKLDGELNVKIIESLKEILKIKSVDITFEIPSGDILEGSSITHDNHDFSLIKRLVVNPIEDVNTKYMKFISKKVIAATDEMSQPQAIEHIKKKTWYLFLLRPIFGKKIRKVDLQIATFRINYNNVIIDLTKEDYDRLNYYTKYVYKLQQLYRLNGILGVTENFNVVFDEDVAAQNMYNSMYDNLKDIIKPRDEE